MRRERKRHFPSTEKGKQKQNVNRQTELRQTQFTQMPELQVTKLSAATDFSGLVQSTFIQFNAVEIV